MSTGKFYCLLNNPSHVPGSVVSGYVNVLADRVHKTKGIQIAFSGSVFFEFTEQLGRNSRQRQASAKIYEQKIILLNDGGRILRLQPGWHKYPFAFRLPPGVPSSFISSKGAVEYSLTATMMGPFKNEKHNLKVSIQDCLDLNIYPNARNPIAFQMQKNCISGPVQLLFKVSKRGFIPGEEFTVAILIHNGSSTTLNRCKLFFIQILSYQAQESIMTTEVKFFLTQVNHAVQKGKKMTCSLNMKIPSVPATDLSSQTPRIIRVKYFFELKLEFPFGTIDISKRVPIIIGTVPIVAYRPASPYIQDSPVRFRDVQSPNPIQVSDEVQNQDNVSISSWITLPPAYEDLPPSYTEAIQMESGEKD